jgi:hypothetical protein
MAKKALCIGINDYPGTGSDLSGCVNDARDWKEALEKRGFTVGIMLDKQATKQAMVEAIRDLIGGAKKGDLVVLQYSGHGTWIPDRSGDEPDRRDECLCPWDIDKNRPLVDDELYDLFSERERGVRIVFISDSCHSGTVARLAPGEPGTAAKVRFLPPEHFLPKKELEAAARIARVSAPQRPRYAALLMSGCLDHEYSYDASYHGRPNGAFTYNALQLLGSLQPGDDYRTWHKAISKRLPSTSYPQTPNLFGSSTQKAWQVFA